MTQQCYTMETNQFHISAQSIPVDNFMYSGPDHRYIRHEGTGRTDTRLYLKHRQWSTYFVNSTSHLTFMKLQWNNTLLVFVKYFSHASNKYKMSNHCGQMTHSWVSKRCHYWFMQWLGACSVPSHFVKQYFFLWKRSLRTVLRKKRIIQRIHLQVRKIVAILPRLQCCKCRCFRSVQSTLLLHQYQWIKAEHTVGIYTPVMSAMRMN